MSKRRAHKHVAFMGALVPVQEAWARPAGAQELPPVEPAALEVAKVDAESAAITLTTTNPGKPDSGVLETSVGALIKMPAIPTLRAALAGFTSPVPATPEVPGLPGVLSLDIAHAEVRNGALAALLETRAAKQTTMLCIGLGLLKDGRHVAFEADLDGPAVTAWRPLCARPQVDGPERAWWQVGFAKLCVKRELLPAEQRANEQDSHGVLAEHFADGVAVAIIGAGRNLTSLALQLEGMTVAEPVVVARGSREYCWSELAAWASLNMLPKRRKS